MFTNLQAFNLGSCNFSYAYRLMSVLTSHTIATLFLFLHSSVLLQSASKFTFLNSHFKRYFDPISIVILNRGHRGRRGCFLLRNLPRLRHFSLRRSYLIIKLSRKRGAFKWHKACLVTKKGFAHFGSNESRKDCLKMFTTIIDLYFFVHSVWPDVAANSRAQFSQKVATVVFYLKVINSKWPKTLLNNLGNKTRKSIFPPILGINSLRS